MNIESLETTHRFLCVAWRAEPLPIFERESRAALFERDDMIGIGGGDYQSRLEADHTKWIPRQDHRSPPLMITVISPLRR